MKINVVILSAGVGWRMKSKEPRSTLVVNEESILEKIYKQFKKLEDVNIIPSFYVISGYKHNKIVKTCKNIPITVINNPNYITGQITSINTAIENILDLESTVFIHGDLILDFDPCLYNFKESFILYDKNGKLKSKEVGVNFTEGKVNVLQYGLDVKWCQIVNISKKEMDILKKMTNIHQDTFTFEIINKIINNGGSFNAHEFVGNISEIDRIKDLKNANFNC